MNLLIDWLAREGGIILSWWALVSLAGAAVLPLCMRLFEGLPDRGYTLARAAGLLVVGFVFWTLAVLGFVRNTPGNIVFAWAVVAVGSWVAFYTIPGDRPNWRDWWQENRSAVIAGELIFVVMLFGWALLRASHPALVATEKPMELAFMSAVQRSEFFPPNDPWMSGYAISYYHFGYIMSAALSSLSGISSAIGFNMTIALLFALTGLNTFGVVYNLVRANGEALRRAAVVTGLLGTIFVTMLSNFQFPLIELPYQTGQASQSWLGWWDVQDRGEAPLDTSLQADPATWDFWWWFRASRTINDRHLPRIIDGESVAEPVGANVIDEFPAFSFILADVHPHVLALPFSVFALGLALNILLSWRQPRVYDLIFYGVAMGGLMFLNMWDGPIYMVVLVGAEGLRRLMRNGAWRLTVDDWLMLGLFFMTLLGLAFFFYLPFFISFRSQASGIIPNIEFPTLFRQYFVMFGPFILLLAPYLVYEVRRGKGTNNWRLAVASAATLAGTLLFVMAFLVIVGSLVPSYRDTVLRYIGERGGLANVLPVLLTKRLTHSLTSIVLLAALAAVLARLFRRGDAPDTTQGETAPYTASTGFALLLIACGAGITLVPEFVYLRDNFGVRINTIFKFYYQAWVMFGIGAAYAVYVMLGTAREQGVSAPVRVGYGVVTVVVLLAGLPYTILGVHNRGVVESGRISNPTAALTLDGGPSLVTQDDYDAITCLADLVEGSDDVVVAEAIGPAYRNQYGRVGVLTGIPIVLGWEGHQRQWRGPTYPAIAGTRRTDVEMLYNDPRWPEAVSIIQRYGIDYIFYGSTERNGTGDQPAYSAAGEDKFIENLPVVCQHGNSLFYHVTPRALQVVGANS